MSNSAIVVCLNPKEKKKEKFLFSDISNSNKKYTLDFNTFFKTEKTKKGEEYTVLKSQWQEVFALITKEDFFIIDYETVQKDNIIKNIKHMSYLLPADSLAFVNSAGANSNNNYGLMINKRPFFHEGKFHHILNQSRIITWKTDFKFNSYKKL